MNIRPFIPVSKPYMPPQKEYAKYLKGIWEREYLTNDGPLVQELEVSLQKYLRVKHLLYVSNGTIALQIAIKALGLKGEIITTPFSYIATTSSIVWEGCKPVFVDIDPNTLNINTKLIEESITSKTTAILATHVFGNPCDIEAIQDVADRYDLKVIYDAAHCLGTKYKGQSIYNYGDISTASFHATKLFHTVEGGAIVTKDPRIKEIVLRMRNFGHAGLGNFEGVGINGKNSEFHAAMGLCNLKYIDIILKRRREQWQRYDELLKEQPIRSITINPYAKFNYAYYPVIFESEEVALLVKTSLEEANIYPRRYFWPSLCELDYVKGKSMHVSLDISKKILCLPLYHDLQISDQQKIATVFEECLEEEIYE